MVSSVLCHLETVTSEVNMTLELRSVLCAFLAVSVVGCDAITKSDNTGGTPVVDAPVVSSEVSSELTLDLSAFTTSDSVTVELSDGKLLLSGTGGEAPVSTGKTGGSFIEIPVFGSSFEGSDTALVTAEVAAVGEGVATLAIAYSTSAIGNSGWQMSEVGSTMGPVTLEYTIPDGEDGNPDYIGLWVPGEGTVEVSSVTVRAK